MLSSVAVVTGFQQEIRNKVVGFGGHINITNYHSSNEIDAEPILSKQEFKKEITLIPEVRNIQAYAILTRNY